MTAFPGAIEKNTRHPEQVKTNLIYYSEQFNNLDPCLKHV